MPGPPPEVTTKRLPPRLKVLGPLREQRGERARVLVVVGHFHRGFGAAAAQFSGGALFDIVRTRGLFFFGSGLAGTCVFEQLEFLVGLIEGAEAGRSEENDGVLNAFAAKARQRFGILRHNADDAAVGTVKEGLVFVGEGGTFERLGRLAGHA